MQVQLPRPLHGWRAFLGEVGIIVLGVLLALGAGQLVEMLHRGDQARLAEHAMILELAEDDGPQAYARVAISRCLDNQIALIHDDSAAAPADQLRKRAAVYAPPFRTWDNEAWKAVVSSDVANYMGAERLVGWSAAYRVVPGLSDTNLRETELASELRDALPPSGNPSPADRQNLRRVAGQLRMSNDRLTRGSQLFLARTFLLGAKVSVATQQTLLREARSIYGACVIAPELRAPAAAQNPRANLLGFVH